MDENAEPPGSPRLNLQDFFDDAEDYVVLRLPEPFPRYADRSDLDILCGHPVRFLQRLLRAASPYEAEGWRVQVAADQWQLHVDFLPPGSDQLQLRFDLIGSFDACRKVRVSPAYPTEILRRKRRMERDGVTVLVPRADDELALRLVEYFELRDERPDKVKHLRHVERANATDFVERLHRFTNLRATISGPDGSRSIALTIDPSPIAADLEAEVSTPFYKPAPSCPIARLSDLYETVFGCRSNGLFVEFATSNGDRGNNTSGLSGQGWRGIRLEPVTSPAGLARLDEVLERNHVEPGFELLVIHEDAGEDLAGLQLARWKPQMLIVGTDKTSADNSGFREEHPPLAGAVARHGYAPVFRDRTNTIFLARDTLLRAPQRLDYFLIWGHGLPHAEGILDIIRDAPEFEILSIVRRRVPDLATFVTELYACDTVPFEHLRDKTRYLLETAPEALFILTLNRNPQERLYGDGPFRHIQCALVKDLKERVRNRFNPRVDGRRTEHHVIHASDYESQVGHALRTLGLPGPEHYLRSPNPDFTAPYHLAPFPSSETTMVPLSELRVRLNGEGLVPIEETPHFRFCEGDRQPYIEYHAREAGLRLTDDHFAAAFDRQIARLDYGRSERDGRRSLIIARRLPTGRHVILDGAHRAAILRSRGETRAEVVLLPCAPSSPEALPAGCGPVARGVVFSKDRPLQLHAFLNSLFRRGRDARRLEVVALCVATSARMERQYASVADEFSGACDIRFLRERNFESDVRALLGDVEHVLFAVDDTLFVRDFEIAPLVNALRRNSRLLGVSLRLGRNCVHCYSYDAPQRAPEFSEAREGLLEYDWTRSPLEEGWYDFGYPLEVSSSIYRSADILRALDGVQFNHPNALETFLHEHRNRLAADRPLLACFPLSVAFSAPLNRVQNHCPNRHAAGPGLTAEALAEHFDAGRRIRVDSYLNMEPRACHQEIDLIWESAGPAAFDADAPAAESSRETPGSTETSTRAENGPFWRAQLPAELSFWEEFIRTRGMDQWRDELQARLDPNRPLQPEWIECLRGVPHRRVAILDVGAGPLTSLGKVWPGRRIELRAVDVLAGDYNRALDRHGLTPPVRTEPCEAEELDREFPVNSFDLVHARNAIDHCRDPIAAIEQMVAVARVGGIVALEHGVNEARRSGYDGLHQWNFFAVDGDFLVGDASGNVVNVTERLRPRAQVACVATDSWISVRIRKVAPTDPPNPRPVVSVIIPCHNQARFLAEAVESVVAQTFTDWECVIVNDGSPDNTSEVARDLIARHPACAIRLIEKPNGGLADARNTGIRQSSGRYILPLDADDRIAPRYLERTVALLEEHRDAGIAATCRRDFGEVSQVVLAHPYTLEEIAQANRINYCSLYRRELWDAIGGYDTRMRWQGYEDWDFWISAAERGVIARIIPEPLFEYRVKSSSMFTEALEHDAELRAEIVLKHPKLHPPEVVSRAAATLRQPAPREATPAVPTQPTMNSSTSTPPAPAGDARQRLEATKALALEALDLNPHGVEALRLLATVHARLGEWVEAGRVCVRLLNIAADDVDALIILASCLAHGGDPETGRAALERALQIDPENAIARQNLADLDGQIARRAGEARLAQCIEECRVALQSGDIAAARARLEEAAELDPADAEIHASLGNLRAAQGDIDGARTSYARALSIDPNFHEARTRLLELTIEADDEPASPNAQAAAAQPAANGAPAAKPPPSPCLETISCPFCGGDEAHRVRAAADIVQCDRCETVYLRTRFTRERMEELYQSYADDGSHMAIPKSLNEANSSCLKRDYFLREILEIEPRRGPILDIGCGWGAFLLNARDHGFEPSGVELTRKAVRYANETLGIPVVSTQFPDTPYEEESRQVITMLHVLEHLTDPKAALEKVFRTLRPGGLFCGIVPNFDSFCSRQARDQWHWLDPNYHYVHYTPETLRRRLEAAGFIVERIYTALGDYGTRMHRAVSAAIHPGLNDDDAFNRFLESLNQNGQGEEIRFFARRPVAVPKADHDDGPLDEPEVRARLGHVLRLPEPLPLAEFRAARAGLEAIISAEDPVEYARSHREILTRPLFALIDVNIAEVVHQSGTEAGEPYRALRRALFQLSDFAPPAREPGYSFCVITNGKRPEKLRRAIESIRALHVPNSEILVGGEPPADLEGVTVVEAVAAARDGRLGEMRNRLLDRARFDHVVMADDDLLFQSDFWTGLQKFGEDYDVLCVRFLNPDGTRYWDWATNAGPRGHALLPYDQTDPHVYVTGGLCVMKAEVGDIVRWSDGLGFYHGEDADFSRRLHEVGMRIRFNPHSTVIHDDRRNTEWNHVVINVPALRQHALTHLIENDIPKVREIHARLTRMEPPSPESWDAFLFDLHTRKRDGRYIEFGPEVFPGVDSRNATPEFFGRVSVNLSRLLRQVGPFYFHCGGAGDALLLLSTFYDRHPNATVVSLPNSIPAAKSLFDAFPKLEKVCFLPANPDPHYHLLVRMMMKLQTNCRGVGVTPYESYSEWNATFDIFRQRGVVARPRWAAAFRKDEPGQSRPRVAIAPRGSLMGMIGSKRNQIDPALWSDILQFLISRGLKPVILGTPNEREEYPAPEGVEDRRSFSFREQMEIIAGSRLFVGADSWGKTFAALVGAPTIVFDSMRGDDWAGKKDASDFVFIDPWKDITLVRRFSEFQSVVDDILSGNLPRAGKAAPAAHAAARSSGKNLPAIHWRGSFLDFGSLSAVNRALCDALEATGEFTIARSESAPRNGRVPESLTDVAARVNGAPKSPPAVTVRHAWPPDWTRPASGKLVVIQPWEFGALPAQWVKNASAVDEFWVPSRFVRDCYVESGVPATKVRVVPNGVDTARFHPDVAPRDLPTRKSFRFLFVGGTIHRKGPDILLRAYLETFTAADDVCLVIKDFGGQSVYAGQTLEARIRAAQALPNAPEILYLNEEWPADQLPSLFTACHCLVHPYRGEGFGLPVLEAMACGLPVIVTEGGPTDEFTQPGWSWRVPANRRNIGSEISGLRLAHEGWLLEPDIGALASRMREAASDPAAARARGALAARHAREHWSWQQAARVAAERLRALTAGATATARGRTSPLELPRCAQVGHLGPARELLRQKKYREAWQATLDALARRPFHPEARLHLAEIARAAGHPALARRCAQSARDLAPSWKPARKFLKALPPCKDPGKPVEGFELPPELSAAQREPRLSVCLIVRNEEKFLARCLESVRGLARQIVVVDTGSTDRTVEIARAFGAEIREVAWQDDFSAARNAALELATGDWILAIDADEELPASEHAKLRADIAKANVLGFRIPLINVGHEAEGVSYVPRLFRNAPGLFYVSRVHEQVFSSLLARAEEWGLENALGTPTLLHHGYTKELVQDRRKTQRNLRLLERAVQEIPADANLLMNLGLELVRSGDFAAGLARYQEAFAALAEQPAQQQVPELRETLLTQLTSHLMRAGRHEEIVTTLRSRVARLSRLSATLQFTLGLALMKTGRIEEAAEAFRACVASRNQRSYSPANPEIFRAGPNHCLAKCLWKLGNAEAAKAALDAALRDEPESRPARMDLARVQAAEKNPVEALKTCHALITSKPDDLEAWALGAEIALGNPGLLEFAVEWTGEAVKHAPASEALAGLRAQALMLSGDSAGAIPFWREAARAPNALSARAALVLCQIVSGAPPNENPVAQEPAVSAEFLKWYQRMVESGANAALCALNARTRELSAVLPTAARRLEAAFADAA